MELHVAIPSCVDLICSLWTGPELSFQRKGLSLEANTELSPLILCLISTLIHFSVCLIIVSLALPTLQELVGALRGPVCSVIKHRAQKSAHQ